MTLFKNTYRVETTRLQDYDYASAGWYHVVICTAGRRYLFGEVVEGRMRPSAVGTIAHRYCAGIPDHVDGAVVDAFVVMPNHAHAIIGITTDAPDDDAPGETPYRHDTAVHGDGHGHDDDRRHDDDDQRRPDDDRGPDDHRPVETLHATSPQQRPDHSTPNRAVPPRSDHSTPNRALPQRSGRSTPRRFDQAMAGISPGAGSLSAIVRSYKSAVTRWARAHGHDDFAWQPRFYERVIRSERELDATRAYVRANPTNWHQDRLYR